MKRIFVFLLILFYINLYSQHNNDIVGARASGLGQAAVCLDDFWSVANNQAGLADYKNIAAGIYYENRFLAKELSLKSFAFIIPSSKGVFGINYNSFGFNLYNENKFGLAYSKKLFKNLSIGIQLDYLRTHIAENYGNFNNITFEIGLRSSISKDLIIAAHIYNPVAVKLSEKTQERIPSVINLGFLYMPVDDILLTAEIEKDIYNKPDFRVGIEYHPVKPLYLRTGITTNPFTNSFGFGLQYKALAFDFSSSYHYILGYSPQISIIYNIK